MYGSGIRDFHHAMSMSHGVSESRGKNINQLFCLPPFDTSRYDSDSEALRHKRMDLAAFLPYRINPDADNHCFREYEDKCLFDFEAKVCMSKAKGGRAIVALLIEPILAGCGASMSTRALSILGAICQKHSICVIVDEILTAGRCFDDCLLYTCKRFPKILYDQVSHITMGKWFGCGIVLAKKYIQHTPHVEDWKIDTISARGSSTLMNLSQPMQRLKRWTDLSKKGNMDLCREALFSVQTKKNPKSKLPPMEEWWGAGLLIFIPGGLKTRTTGLHSRLLPRLYDLTPGEDGRVKTHRMNLANGLGYGREKGYSAVDLNKLITSRTVEWISKIPGTWQERNMEKQALHLAVTSILSKRVPSPDPESLDPEILKKSTMEWSSEAFQKKGHFWEEARNVLGIKQDGSTQNSGDCWVGPNGREFKAKMWWYDVLSSVGDLAQKLQGTRSSDRKRRWVVPGNMTYFASLVESNFAFEKCQKGENGTCGCEDLLAGLCMPKQSLSSHEEGLGYPSWYQYQKVEISAADASTQTLHGRVATLTKKRRSSQRNAVSIEKCNLNGVAPPTQKTLKKGKTARGKLSSVPTKPSNPPSTKKMSSKRKTASGNSRKPKNRNKVLRSKSREPANEQRKKKQRLVSPTSDVAPSEPKESHGENDTPSGLPIVTVRRSPAPIFSNSHVANRKLPLAHRSDSIKSGSMEVYHL